jgi:hypothetical protein
MVDRTIIFNAIKMSPYQQLTYLNHRKRNFLKTTNREMPKKLKKEGKTN